MIPLRRPSKSGVRNDCNWKLRHYRHEEWTFGPCKIDVAESSSKRVVATRNQSRRALLRELEQHKGIRNAAVQQA